MWQADDDKKKYHLVKWKTCCMPKSQGGLGILNLDLFNKALLAKWLWKLESESGFWQDILFNKYVGDKCLSGIVHRAGDSQFWASILKIKDLFYRHIKKKLGDGKKPDSGKAGGWGINH